MTATAVPPEKKNPTTLRHRQLDRLGQLKNRRTHYMARCQDASDFILPFNGRYFTQDRDQHLSNFNNIYDSSGTRAARIHAAGMLAGASSPARLWFRCRTLDRDLDKNHAVREWLDKLAMATHLAFHAANVYRSLHSCYEEQGVFGTAACILRDHPTKLMHMHMLTAGEFYLATDDYEDVCTLYREYEMTVGQLVRRFGKANCTKNVQRMHERGELETGICVYHAIEPREDRDPGSLGNLNMEWASYYFEAGSQPDEMLGEGGFDKFPALTPRWAVRPGDVYGYSPGMEALADIRGLQAKQLLRQQAIENQGAPPLQIPTSMRERDLDILPHGLSFYDQTSPHGGIRTAFEVSLNLDHMLADIVDTRQMIDSAYYVPLFLLMANNQTDRKTQVEVASLLEEKWFVLAPIIARQHDELLRPLVEDGVGRILRSGRIPPPPPDLQGQELKVEFVSMLAQAQHAVTTSSVDRWLGFVTATAQAKPEALDVVNTDRMVRDYADMIGVPAEMLVDPDKVDELREARDAANAAKEQSAMMEQQASTTQKLAASPTGGAGAPNALTEVMSQTSGYQSPSVVESGL